MSTAPATTFRKPEPGRISKNARPRFFVAILLIGFARVFFTGSEAWLRIGRAAIRVFV
jgi:hypothetical protein